jgi:hypothetical protein
MTITRLAGLVLAALLLADPTGAAEPAEPRHIKAVLVAADDSLPVFDNAVRRLAHDLAPRADVTVISARLEHASTMDAALRAIRGLRPRPGEGCLIYVTSHGAHDAGLVFDQGDDVLSPAALAAAVAHGCGAAPTVVVLSGCYSGIYARPPLARDNRIVITAARADRPSFGCAAGNVYTVFDQCLLTAIEAGGTWRVAFGQTRACVAAEETREQERPSDPQASFGSAVAGLALP